MTDTRAISTSSFLDFLVGEADDAAFAADCLPGATTCRESRARVLKFVARPPKIGRAPGFIRRGSGIATFDNDGPCGRSSRCTPSALRDRSRKAIAPEHPDLEGQGAFKTSSPAT